MTVRQVHDEIAKDRPVGYTTTLKIMQIMFEKGLLTREKQGKTHLYINNVDQKSTQNGLVAKMINTVFQGSTKDLVMQALGSSQASKKELDEIRKYLDQLNEEKNA